jgi:L-alanine-DL-glutamate epimerase-like enolase superfamily enzyme
LETDLAISSKAGNIDIHHYRLPDGAGHITLSDAPGLGVEIDWQALKPLRVGSGTMEL